MQLFWGSSSFAANSVQCVGSSTLIKTAANMPKSIRRTVQVSGYLLASGQVTLMQQESALKTAMANQFRDLKFFADDLVNQSPSLTLLNAPSISGVTIIDGPNFDGTYGAEYATQRKFNFTAQAEYALPGSFQLLSEYHESLMLSGGIPKFVCRPALDTRPIRYMTYAQMPYCAVQQGHAVGFLSYPFGGNGPPQIFPQFLKEAPTVTLESAQRSGSTYQEFPLSWRYTFESPTPLLAGPTQWPLGL